jgi:hypothetical protein
MSCTEPPVARACVLCALEVAGWVTALLDVTYGGGRGAWPGMIVLVFSSV